MNGEQLICVLCNPEESANIGSVCRAMKTMGLSHLRIVGKKESYDENRVHTLALAAFSVWKNTTFFNSLQEAVSDCAIAAGTTRRFGKKRKNQLLFPQEFAELAARITAGKNVIAAIVFGNERTGLTDEELNCCTVGVTIPTSPEFGSLNLSHAVQLIAWELFKTENGGTACKHAAPVSRIEQSADYLIGTLEKLGFFKTAGKTEALHFCRDLLSRAGTSEEELKRAEKIASKIIPLAEKYKKNS